jgi:eukaryotic-like serine/threonine-protein kinase
LKRPKEAVADLQRARQIFTRLFGADPPGIGVTLVNEGGVAESDERWDDARSLFEQAAAHLKRTLGEANPYYANALYNLADVQQHLGQASEALASAQTALAMYERASGPDSLELASPLNLIGRLHLEGSRPRDALVRLERGARIATAAKDRSRTAALLLRNLGDAACRTGDRRRALSLARAALELGSLDEEESGNLHAWLSRGEPGCRDLRHD